MGLFGYIGNWIAERREADRRVNEEYARVYRRCFEGTPEQAKRRLENWDLVHRATRSYQL